MSGDINRDGIRGFGLQCPWSNCFPQLYADSRTPCALTRFADFREITDHIWKYHSFLLSCDNCDHRFSGAKRTEKDRSRLKELKDEHANKCVGNEHSIKTMTSQQDKILKEWRAKNNKDQGSMKPNYDSLCRSLFGDGVQLPENPEYHYYIPEYTTNAVSYNCGQRNIEYLRQRQSATQLASTSSSQQQLNPVTYRTQHSGFIPQQTTNPLLLDEIHQPDNWALMKPLPDQDSGYGSNGTGESQPNTGGYINPWHMNLRHFDQNIASTGAFSQGALEQRPPAIDLGMDWEPEDSEGPSG